MNRTGFYFKMAWSSITKNAKFYIPYILTSFITITMFYTLDSLYSNSNLPSSSSFKTLMGYGMPIVLLFSAIFLFYTNSFLIRKRKSEFGLFNILGMEKRHIMALISVETFIIAAISIVLGLGIGILVNRLIFLILNKVVMFVTPMVFEISMSPILKTFLFFAIIYIAILIKNIVEVVKVKPIELLSAERSGEREPKAKWLIAILGVACIIAGYVLSISTHDALSAITFFFVAVLLVIIGTYLLFISGTIAFLKLLQKNKNYYYKTNHFVSLSGMLYRMKQNGVGLANICILSTMVIVMIGTTVSLYAGATDIINTRYPAEITTTYDEADDTTLPNGREIVNKVSKDTGIEVENYVEYTYLSVAESLNKNYEFYLPADYEAYYCDVLPELDEDCLYIVAKSDNAPDYLGNSINFCDEEFKIKDISRSQKVLGQMSVMVTEAFAVVCPTQEIYDKVDAAQKKFFSEREGMLVSLPICCINFDLATDEVGEQKFFEAYKGAVDGYAYLRSAQAKDFAELTGSFLFLGVFLGILFLMATVLIMYYKQIVEGYDDKKKFEILQNVGMSKDEVKRTVRSQVVILFFLPLIVAFCHMGFAIPMLVYLLSAFAIKNTALVVICCAVTCLIYAIIYAIVYSATAKTYYKIVN